MDECDLSVFPWVGFGFVSSFSHFKLILRYSGAMVVDGRNPLPNSTSVYFIYSVRIL